MPIQYTDYTGKTLVAHIAPGISAEQAATAMRLTPGTWREITDAEAAERMKPTAEEARAAALAAFTGAIQTHLDAFAQTRSYDGIMSAATYATSTVPKFAAEGQYAVEARDLTWAKAYEIMNAVLAGKCPMPDAEQILAELPALAWPKTL